MVSDLDRALALYRDILRLSVEFMHESEADSYSYPVFEIDRAANLRFCVLSTATQPRVLALTEVTGIELPDNPMPRRAERSFDCGSMLLFRTTPDNIFRLEKIADGADR